MLRLSEAIEELLKEKFDASGIKFQSPIEEETETPEEVIPHIWVGDLPPKRASVKQGKDFPYIVIRPDRETEGKDEYGSDVTTAKIFIFLGVFSKSTTTEKSAAHEGFINLFNLKDTVRRFLSENPNIGFMPGWIFDKNYTFVIDDETDPFYKGIMELNFKRPLINSTEQTLMGAK